LFSRQLLELLALSIEAPKAARKLVELVGEDYGLTCKVLQIANSFHYNRSNRPIENVSHAIVVLGAGTVQTMASTLVCLQSCEQRSASLQQLMVRSMVSAHVAAVAAEELGGSSDREVAYLAGMLQNLGEVLVAHHSPVQYAAIQGQIEAGCSRDAATVKTMGFTFDALARVVGRHWKLPPRVCSLWDPDIASTELSSLARFGNELTRVMCFGGTGHRQAGMALLLMHYGWELHLTEDSITEVWDRALGETREVFDTLGVSMGPLSVPAANPTPPVYDETFCPLPRRASV
jgi:hypothetical protein